ncbi:hypothetical protein [[Eubacterium] cellulosolvens]
MAQDTNVPTEEHSYTSWAVLHRDGDMAVLELSPSGPRPAMSPINTRVNNVTKCARCGLDIERPMKEWNMQPRDGRGPALHVKHYACPQCGKKFRVADKLAGA